MNEDKWPIGGVPANHTRQRIRCLRRVRVDDDFEEQYRSCFQHQMRTDKFRHDRNWWFASTAIPLISASIAPAANVFSIAALVQYWKTRLYAGDGSALPPLTGRDIPDPDWIYWPNLASLLCGYLGNLLLLLNLANRLPYVYSLPATICFWYLSAGLLTGIQISFSLKLPPGPREAYTQAFWYGVISSTIYFSCGTILLVNLLGYLRGHYARRFQLTDAQRTLMLQSFLFFIWLAGAAGVFQAVQKMQGSSDRWWSYPDALYFCDVIILTIGFGDELSANNIGRSLVLPYSIGGIITLGLMISSIVTFTRELSSTNLIERKLQKSRQQTAARTVRSGSEAERVLVFTSSPRGPLASASASTVMAHAISRPYSDPNLEEMVKPLRRVNAGPAIVKDQRRNGQAKLQILKEDKDRFTKMRRLQDSTRTFKKWSVLVSSLSALVVLLLVGAAIFWQLEKDYQGWTYFNAVYFCYISLLTIGYGDLTPKTNAGRPMFVLWSLLAVPFVTVLISSLSETVIQSFNDWTNALTDTTFFRKTEVWRKLSRWISPKLRNSTVQASAKEPADMGATLESGASEEKAEGRIMSGQTTGPTTDRDQEHQLAERLVKAIVEVAHDVKQQSSRLYTYEEWVKFTDLIRFTQRDMGRDEGVISWDWLDERGPIAAGGSEPAWLLDRLMESLGRYVRNQGRAAVRE